MQLSYRDKSFYGILIRLHKLAKLVSSALKSIISCQSAMKIFKIYFKIGNDI